MEIGINLNELIFDENESFEEPKKKKSFHFKSDIKRIRNGIKSPISKYRKYSQESGTFRTPTKNLLYKGFENIKTTRTISHKIIHLNNINDINVNDDYDKKDISKKGDFLFELLFRLIDY